MSHLFPASRHPSISCSVSSKAVYLTYRLRFQRCHNFFRRMPCYASTLPFRISRRAHILYLLVSRLVTTLCVLFLLQNLLYRLIFFYVSNIRNLPCPCDLRYSLVNSDHIIMHVVCKMLPVLESMFHSCIIT